jgi:hypothetical protein
MLAKVGDLPVPSTSVSLSHHMRLGGDKALLSRRLSPSKLTLNSLVSGAFW